MARSGFGKGSGGGGLSGPAPGCCTRRIVRRPGVRRTLIKPKPGGLGGTRRVPGTRRGGFGGIKR